MQVQSKHSIRLADYTTVPDGVEIAIILANSRDRKGRGQGNNNKLKSSTSERDEQNELKM